MRNTAACCDPAFWISSIAFMSASLAESRSSYATSCANHRRKIIHASSCAKPHTVCIGIPRDFAGDTGRIFRSEWSNLSQDWLSRLLATGTFILEYESLRLELKQEYYANALRGS